MEVKLIWSPERSVWKRWRFYICTPWRRHYTHSHILPESINAAKFEYKLIEWLRFEDMHSPLIPISDIFTPPYPRWGTTPPAPKFFCILMFFMFFNVNFRFAHIYTTQTFVYTPPPPIPRNNPAPNPSDSPITPTPISSSLRHADSLPPFLSPDLQ